MDAMPRWCVVLTPSYPPWIHCVWSTWHARGCTMAVCAVPSATRPPPQDHLWAPPADCARVCGGLPMLLLLHLEWGGARATAQPRASDVGFPYINPFHFSCPPAGGTGRRASAPHRAVSVPPTTMLWHTAARCAHVAGPPRGAPTPNAATAATANRPDRPAGETRRPSTRSHVGGGSTAWVAAAAPAHSARLPLPSPASHHPRLAPSTSSSGAHVAQSHHRCRRRVPRPPPSLPTEASPMPRACPQCRHGGRGERAAGG